MIYPTFFLIEFLCYLCDVSTRVLPEARILDSVSHSKRLATGSIPDVGSSRKITGGSPIKAIAVLNLRLLPPLKLYITKDK